MHIHTITARLVVPHQENSLEYVATATASEDKRWKIEIIQTLVQADKLQEPTTVTVIAIHGNYAGAADRIIERATLANRMVIPHVIEVLSELDENVFEKLEGQFTGLEMK